MVLNRFGKVATILNNIAIDYLLATNLWQQRSMASYCGLNMLLSDLCFAISNCLAVSLLLTYVA